MAMDDMYIYFSVNLDSLKIVQCSQKKYLNYDYEAFFDSVFRNVILDTIAKFDSNVLLEYLRAKKKVQFDAHNGNEYVFDIKYFDESIANCSVFILYDLDMKKDNNIDFLTSVYNRSYITKEIESRLRNGASKSYALGIVDLNNFKNINDRYGHLAGDKVLKSFTNEIANAVGDALFGRYGGDEFIIFIENPSTDELTEIARKILSISYKPSENKRDNVTACLGFSETKGDVLSFDYLFETADVALYKAKKSGKRAAFLDDNILYSLNKNYSKENKNSNFRLFDAEMKNIKIKQLGICFCITLVFLAIISLAMIYLKNSIYELNINETNNTMNVVSEQIETNIDKSIDSYFSHLIMVKQLINYDDNRNYNDVLKGLDGKLAFEQIGLLLPSGDILFSDRTYNIAQEKLAIEIIINGNSYIDNIYFNKLGERMVFAVPYSDESNTFCGIVGVLTIEEFKDYLNATAFNGTATVAITNHDGNFVAISGNQKFELINILKILRRALGDEKYLPVKEAFKNNESKIVNVELSGVDTFLYFTTFDKVKGNNTGAIDWHIIITVPTIEINKTISNAFDLILISFLVFGVAIILILTGFLLFFSSSRIQIKRNKCIDDITGGLNYNRFIIDANTLAKNSEDYAVVLANCIKFKYINEQIGKQKSDALLKEIYDIYLNNLAKDELISRVYADRFILLIHNNDLENRILKLNDEIKKTVIMEYNINIYNVFGVFNTNKKIDDVGFAGNMARIALKTIKDNYAITPISYFDSTMYVNEITLNSLEQKADSALRNNSFVVYYQGKKNIQNNKWCSCEALVRWRDTDGSLISPGKFIPLFESNGFIIQLDLYIFEIVCKDIRDMLDNNGTPTPVSINVSRKHFINKNFLSSYKKIIDKYNIPHNLLEFEITESTVFENENILVDIIHDIHEMGCICSIDDFGTGYSSLSLLTNYEFDIIKLDRSFFYGKNGFTNSSKQVVKTLIVLAHELKKQVVAEGVEEREMVDFLRDAKCDIIQGYYYAKPLPKDEFLELIKK